MKTDVRRALISMGYREREQGRWLKPVGFVTFVFNEDGHMWSMVFKDQHGKLSLYQRELILPDKDFLHMLKHSEAFTRVDLCTDTGSAFEFVNSIGELLDL